MSYTELYDAYEENAELHTETPEVEKAEREFTELLRQLPKETMLELDILAGKLIVAYEKRGFLFGLNVQSALFQQERGRQ